MEEIPIVLIGEKDHGKSTLIGRLLLDTKTIKERKLKEIKEVDKALGKEFELAHLVDAFREEREREMTMDTTSVLIKGKKRDYSLIDVPGHEELISQMLTGASKAKSALLLVAVDEGIKPQTITHLKIAKLLGIERLGVAINKMDKINYKKREFKKLINELKEILEKIGYLSEKTKFFPISALNGDNVIEKSSRMPWYKKETLFEYLEKLPSLPSLEDFPFSFIVQDFYEEGKEKILVGKVETGKVKTGEKVLVLPQEREVKIKKIIDAENEIFEANSGESVGIILEEDVDVERGIVLTSFDFPRKVSNLIKVKIFWLRKPKEKNLILECGTKKVISQILNPREIEEMEVKISKISLSEALVFETKYNTILNKIVLKERGEIIAIGKIIK